MPRSTFSLALDLVKKFLVDDKISKKRIHDILQLISYYYGNKVNMNELKRFLFTSYASKDHFLYSLSDKSILETLAFIFLLYFYITIGELAEKLVEREILTMLLNRIDYQFSLFEVRQLFYKIFWYLQQLQAEQDFVNWLIETKNSNEVWPHVRLALHPYLKSIPAFKRRQRLETNPNWFAHYQDTSIHKITMRFKERLRIIEPELQATFKYSK